MKMVFLGTPEIAVPSLDYFIKKNGTEILAVITQPDKPAGRGQKVVSPPVKVLAEANDIKVYQPKSIRKDEELIAVLKNLKPDVFITVAFGQILSKEVLDIPRLGVINLHASLLPKYRGPNPIQWAIINGDKVTGVTTMRSDAGVDTGDMLLKKEIPITENMDSCELYNIIANMGPEVLYETITGLDNGTIIPVPQSHEEATHAPKLRKEDGLINWNETAEQIHNKVRGMKPWPSTYTYFKDNIMKITQTLLPNNEENLNDENTGVITGIINNGIGVSTKNGILMITKLQPAGKKEMDAKSWYCGARIQKGERFQSNN